MSNQKQTLFTANVHSEYTIHWLTVPTSRSRDIRVVLRDAYGLLEPEAIAQVGALEMRSNNFKITYRSSGQRKTVLLRKNIQHQTPEALRTVNATLRYLRAHAIAVPEIITTLEGKDFATNNGVLWQMFGFVHGTYYRGTHEELIEVSGAVAKLHKALVNMPLASSATEAWTLPTLEDFEPFFEKASTDPDDIGEMVRENKALMRDTIAEVGKDSVVILGAETQPIHADLHPHNFIFEKNKLVAILDFGDVRSGFRAADAANACHRLVRQFVVHEKKPWEESLIIGLKSFLDAYQTIYRLPPKELAALGSFMALAVLRKMKGNLRKYYGKDPEWPHHVAHKEFEKQITLLLEITAMRPILDRISINK